LLVLGLPTLSAVEKERPNIIVILVDDLGYNDHSLGGSSAIETPGLEHLAEHGVVFDQGFVTHSFCGPSRAGLLTGRHQARFGLETNPSYSPYDGHHGLPLDEKLISEYLSEVGYRTGIIGKWHMGAAPEYHPLNRGFDEFFGFLSGGHDYFKIDTTAAHKKNGQLLYSPIEGEFLPLSRGRGAADFEGYLTDALTDEAIRFIEAGRDEPYFLYLAYNTPHGPLQAPSERVEKYKGSGDWARATYLAMIDVLDENIARLIEVLKERGAFENSLIFFLGDNGGVHATSQRAHENWADNSPLRAGKGSFHDGGIRVPFMASWPAKWGRGQRYMPMVSSLDIAATALTAAGVEASQMGRLDGVNLSPYLSGQKKGEPHQYLFWRSAYNDSFAVRTNDYKLMRDASMESPMCLYHLIEDPAEADNILKTSPAEARSLAAAWNEWNRLNIENKSLEAFHYQQVRERFYREQAEALIEKSRKRAAFQIQLD
jgi:arylsulfatase A-like enzyme